MTVHDIAVRTIDGDDTTLAAFAGRVVLVVNVASKCGLTRQYEGLQKLHDEYADRGFSVLGFPCNQFAGQEPGSPEEIKEFCSLNFGVSFPLFTKIDVNGEDRHPLYEHLAAVEDDEGKAGDVAWNFEKFLISPEGEVVRRFRPLVAPDDAELVQTIEKTLP